MKRGKKQLLVIGGMILLISTVSAQYSSDYGTHLDDDLLRQCNRQTAYSTGVSDARKGLARKEDYAQICRTNRDIINAAYLSGFNYGLTNQSGLIVNEPAPNHPEIYSQYPSSYVQPYTRAAAVPANPNVAPIVPQAGSAVVVAPGYSAMAGSTYDSKPSRAPIYPSEVNVPSGDFAKPDPEHGLRSLITVGPNVQPKCIETVNGQACGYNCVNTLNNVRCAASPDQICRSNDVGNIACGYNCIATVKTVRCALYRSDVCVSDSNGNVYCGVNCRLEGGATALCDVERYAH